MDGQAPQSFPRSVSMFDKKALAEIKKVKVTFNPDTYQVNLENVPYRVLDGILCAASLYESLSLTGYEVEKLVDPRYSTDENMTYVMEAKKCIEAMRKKIEVAGKTEDDAKIDYDNLTYNTIYKDTEAYIAKFTGPQSKQPIEEVTIPPFSYAYKARLIMMKLMERVGYLASEIRRASRNDQNVTFTKNGFDYARQYIDQAEAEMKLYHEQMTKVPRPNSTDGQDIERAYNGY